MSQENRNKLKLMVVDDEPDNLDLLYRTFRRDFKVFKADSALSALEILNTQGEMAVIISDQRMPLMNGTELLSKTVERFPETIRILLTGYTDVEDLVEAINSGKVFKYITKPWNPEELKTIVKQATDTYRVLKQRTHELRRALRQEELFNVITRAIRESLDYQSTLQTIVNTISENFGASLGILKPIENYTIGSDTFYYSVLPEVSDELIAGCQTLMEQAFQSCHTQIHPYTLNDQNWIQFAVPLTYKQEHLAVISLLQSGEVVEATSDIQLVEAVAEQAALAISQAKLYQRTQQQAQKIQAELEVARQIQMNLLRQSFPEVEGIRVQAHCYAAREVGGDFFEVYVHPQGDIWLAVGDVSGKGVPAALFMASGLSILRRELAQEISPHPETVMQNFNSIMSDDLFSTNCFITMVLARYTPATRELVYANAGHIYPMLWSHAQLVQSSDKCDSEVNYLKDRGVPVGILPVWKGNIGQLTLKSGDIFLLTSDGITEATVTQDITLGIANSDSSLNTKMLNQEGLWQLICQESAPFDLNHLLARIREYTIKVQEDDQTMLYLEVL